MANRNRPETETLIGYFVNVVVVRADLSGDPSFREAVARVRQVALDAFERQEMTLDQVVDAVKPPRDPSRNPIFQVMFALQNIRLPSPPDVGSEDRAAGRQSRAAFGQFRFDAGAVPVDGEFRGSLNFSTDLFRVETVERMSRHFLRLVEQAVAAPDRPVSALPLLDDEERQQLLRGWNPADGGARHDACIHELFELQVERSPDATALIDGPRRWSYRELDHRANQLRIISPARGVGPEQVVAVRLPRSAEWVVGLLAVLKAGGAYLPLDPVIPAERLTLHARGMRGRRSSSRGRISAVICPAVGAM